MRAIAQEIGGAASAGEQKSDRREISLGRIAGLACEDEIVAPIVGRLPASWRHVVERHRGFREALTAVSANGTVLLEKPPPSFSVGDPACRVRGELNRAMRCTALGTLFSAPRTSSPTRALPIGVRVEHFMLSPERSRASKGSYSEMMMRRAAR